jgi:hypothetical protein
MQPLSSDVDLSVIAWTSATGPLLSRVVPALHYKHRRVVSGTVLVLQLEPYSVILVTGVAGTEPFCTARERTRTKRESSSVGL